MVAVEHDDRMVIKNKHGDEELEKEWIDAGKYEI